MCVLFAIDLEGSFLMTLNEGLNLMDLLNTPIYLLFLGPSGYRLYEWWWVIVSSHHLIK